MNNLSRGLLLIVSLCVLGDALEIAPGLQNLRDEDLTKFDQFRMDFKRMYSTTAEFLMRLTHFVNNLRAIEALTLSEKGTAKYAVNDMSDWSEREFAESRANLNVAEFTRSFDAMELWRPVNVTGVSAAPTAYDWRDQGKVTTPKDQGSCGSCWAFSTVGNTGCMDAIKNNRLVDYSEQQLVDCDQRSSGCNGGWMDYAVQSMIERGGIMSASSYPYTGRKGSCRFQKSKAVVQVKSNKKLQAGQEGQMRDFVGTDGCPSNAINANKALQNYRSGIIVQDSRKCPNGNNAINHAVLTVGYGRENGQDFWIMKNSWGTNWGEKGFFRIARGSNTCGISNYVNSVEIL